MLQSSEHILIGRVGNGSTPSGLSMTISQSGNSAITQLITKIVICENRIAIPIINFVIGDTIEALNMVIILLFG